MATPKIVIIGAGASGISAAAKLLENGFTNITILEAENRIGGRINSVAFDGGVVDLGAQWCHGEEDNIVYNTVKDLNLLSPSQYNYDEFTLYDSTGKVIDSDLSGTLLGIAFRILTDADALEVASGSFGDYFVNRYSTEIETEYSDNEDHYKIAKRVVDLFHKFIICLDSAPSWYDISAKHVPFYKHCDGNNYLNWKDQGYVKILHVLMNLDSDHALPFEDKILYQKEVNKIAWGDGSATINCTDGTAYIADHLIVTVSLGVLKQDYKTMFDPELPLVKQNAIKYLGYGCSKKVMLLFPCKWWPSDSFDFSILWREDDREKLYNEFPYGPSYNGHSWLEDVMGFYVVDYHPRVLLAWIVGAHIGEIELLPDNILIDGCMFLLKKFLGNKYDIPRPCDILRSHWKTNPHFCGTYSYQSIDSEKYDALPIHLAEPLRVNNTDVVLFAGEATHPHYFSTVHGAIETGFREANRIIKSYSKNISSNHYQIAIIGAGMAGLGAAYTLIAAGHTNIVILEAQSKAGGRVRTIPLGNGFLELGAQWIHGTNNSLYNLAKQHNLLAPEMSSEGLGLYIRDDGYLFDDYLVKRVDFEVGKILEECEEFTNATTYPHSIGDYLETRFMQYLAECNDDNEVALKKLELLNWHLRFQAIDNSCADLKQLSAKSWGKYCCLDESYGQKHINLKHGYKSILDVIMLNFPNDLIKYNHTVSNVSWKYNNAIRLNYDNNNEFIYCDHLIITASLGVLKEASILFNPCLPSSINRAIQCMGYHAIGKVFLVFDYKWWDTDGFQLIWRKNTKLSKETEWTRNITGFDTAANHPNVLLGWVGGKGVRTMEKLSKSDVGLHCVELLQRFLQRTDIPNPRNIIKSKWLMNKWIKGGYGYTTPECDVSGMGPEILLQPVYNGAVPKILFAGEALHPNHFATTHGAFESGEQQAKHLINYIEGINAET